MTAAYFALKGVSRLPMEWIQDQHRCTAPTSLRLLSCHSCSYYTWFVGHQWIGCTWCNCKGDDQRDRFVVEEEGLSDYKGCIYHKVNCTNKIILTQLANNSDRFFQKSHFFGLLLLLLFLWAHYCHNPPAGNSLRVQVLVAETNHSRPTSPVFPSQAGLCVNSFVLGKSHNWVFLKP